jgi:hypothetical protein
MANPELKGVVPGKITRIAIDYVSNDTNVEVKSKGKEGLWVHHFATAILMTWKA